jgi:magnesium transporter
MKPRKRIQYADDDRYSVGRLAWWRFTPLFVGLILGGGLSFITSRFERVLAESIDVAFFIPLVIYMADAVGTQTQAIYTRDLKTGRAHFPTYLRKESGLGFVLGSVFGLAAALLSWLWLGDPRLSLAVGSAMFLAIFSAPLVALIVTEILELEKTDPAVGAGPIATVIQDTISVGIYGVVATLILLG